MKKKALLIAVLLAGGTATAALAEPTLVEGDLILHNSLCVGADCVADEAFDDDTIRMKSPNPQLRFVDTSSSTFPSHDWTVGATDDGSTGPAYFYIDNLTTGLRVLAISAWGDVTLGAGAMPVEGAVSVGAPGAERRVSHLADGVHDTDAVTLRQFQAFKTEALTQVGSDAQELEATLTDLEGRVSDLSARVQTLLNVVCNGSC